MGLTKKNLIMSHTTSVKIMVTLLVTLLTLDSCSSSKKHKLKPSDKRQYPTMPEESKHVYHYRSVVEAQNVTKPPNFYSQGILADNMLFISGQLGLNKEGVMAVGFEAQAKQCLENIGYILKETRGDYQNVVKTIVLLTDMANFEVFNKIYQKYFDREPPARVAYQVVALPKNGLVEMDATAIVNGADMRFYGGAKHPAYKNSYGR